MRFRHASRTAWVIFACEIAALACLTWLYALLLVLVVRDGGHRWSIPVLLAAAYGLGTLWLLAIRYGPLMKPDPPRITPLVALGAVAGVGVVLALVVRSLAEKDPALVLQALLMASIPVAIAAHMLVRYRRATVKSGDVHPAQLPDRDQQEAGEHQH